MKTQSSLNKLVFNKTAVAELNETQLQDVIGGAGTVTLPTIVITFI